MGYSLNSVWLKDRQKILSENSWALMSRKKMATLLGYHSYRYLKDTVWWYKGYLDCVSKDSWRLTCIPYFNHKNNTAQRVNKVPASLEYRLETKLLQLMEFHIEQKLECARKNDHAGFLLNTGGLYAINHLRETFNIY